MSIFNLRPKHITSERKLYFFRCIKCGKERRTSLFKERADRGICGTCRQIKIPENQMPLIGGKDE